MIPLRRLLGGALRRQRQRQGRTLREVSAAARVSLGYLSEVERGQKEPSSELFAAICVALDVPMSAVLREVSDELAVVEFAAATPAASTASHPPTPVKQDAPVGAASTAQASAPATTARNLLVSAPFSPAMPTALPGDGVAVHLPT